LGRFLKAAILLVDLVDRVDLVDLVDTMDLVDLVDDPAHSTGCRTAPPVPRHCEERSNPDDVDSLPSR
jgi:hypothetical protein